MKKMSNISGKSLLLAGFSAALLFLTACGRKHDPVPTVRADLLLELFRTLDTRDYTAALPRVERYQALEETDVFLGEVRNTVLANEGVRAAFLLAKSGKVDEACGLLDRKIVEHGELPGLVLAKKDLQEILLLSEKLDTLKNPCIASVNDACGLWVYNYGRKIKNETLTRYGAQCRRNTPVLRRIEEDRASFLIYADALDALEGKDFSGACALTAVLRSKGSSEDSALLLMNGGLFEPAVR